MKNVEVYTDGGSLGNPGPGGYGAVILGEERTELSAGYRYTTNNRMEILAAIEALRQFPEDKSTNIILHSDSRLLCDAVNKRWLNGWQRNGWRKADKKPVLNQDLWEQLIEEMSNRSVQFKWVEGHAGIPENERCDELSKQAASEPQFIDEEYEKINKPKDKSVVKPKPMTKSEITADYSLNTGESIYKIEKVQRDAAEYVVISQTKNNKTGRIILPKAKIKEFSLLLNSFVKEMS